MDSPPNSERLNISYQTALSALLAERNSDGYWIGEISPSALATAAAICTLFLVDKNSRLLRNHETQIKGGLGWLAQHQNDDGGWGDTIQSSSNSSTTMLVRAAFHLAGAGSSYSDCLEKTNNYLREVVGEGSSKHAQAVYDRFGPDRTFAAPILSTCALAGMMDWREIKSLPFELACLPREVHRFLRLPVTCCALPALIAIGQLVYYYKPPWNPIIRIIRRLVINKTLEILESMQPESGGFLESVPLTSFVTLSLAAMGLPDHPVARNGLEFIENSTRPDGSWPIASNLSVRVTSLAVNALAAADELPNLEKRDRLRQWLLGQQFTTWQPFSGTKPGGWGWTDLPGSIPNSDDTAGAMLALSRLINLVPDEAPHPSPRAILRGTLQDGGADLDQVAELPRLADLSWQYRPGIQNGLLWLLDLQNLDGGWPTFCRGWKKLAFDRSAADLTAHVLRALTCWKVQMEADRAYHAACGGQIHFAGFPLVSIDRDLERGLEFLRNQQNEDGSWSPLLFRDEHSDKDNNSTIGTACVLAAYRDLDKINDECARRGISYLTAAQNLDGCWGGAPGVPGSVEETALALEVLLDAGPEAKPAVNKGLTWLVEQVEKGGLHRQAPIGRYFANMGYCERLYPIIFTVAALGRARNLQSVKA
jgi:squalene-hopene/tetraprenyl-beta-curcumene cyclase